MMLFRKRTLIPTLTLLLLQGLGTMVAQQSGVREEVWSRVNLQPGPMYPVLENPVTYPSVIKIGDLPPQDSPDIQITTSTSVTQSENSVCVSPLNDLLLLNSNNSSNYPVTSIVGADGFTSTNGGQSWTGSTAGVGGTNSGDPAVAIDLNGRFYVGYIKSSGQGCAYSTNNGATWTHVQVAPNPGSLADKNHLTVDNNPSSPYANNLYSTWTDFGGTNNNNVVVSRSTDAGLTWSTRVNISAGVSAGNHNQGVNIQTGPNGEVYAVWAIYDSWPSDEVRLGFAKSTNGGASWLTATRIGPTIKGIRNSILLGGKDMRVNSFPSMAVNQLNGHIYVVWTNIGVPGVNSGSERDIYMIRSTDGGTTWETAVRVNQDALNNGKDQWFPWIACDPVTGTLVVIFYDSRDFASNDQANTYVAYSQNGGGTWVDFRVSDVSWSGDGSGTGFSNNYAGDYISVAIRNNKVYPVWTDRRASGGRLSTYISPFVLGNSITVTSPVGGEVWGIGSAQNITWTSSGVSGNVNIEMSTDGGVTFPTMLFANTANDGTEAWTVGGPSSTTARIRITSVNDATIRDSSHANFTMAQPTITVSTPNGGESWAIGSTQTITWSSANLSGNVKIELSTDGGATYPTVIAASTPNDGGETWVVSGPVSTTARVRITSVSLPSVVDASDGNFSMVQPSVTVTSPNGGESWFVGSSHNITWSSANLPGNVKIELSTNGGASFPTILFASTVNDGSEAWTVGGPVTSSARLRITSLSIPTVSDTSDAIFSIVQPTITVTSPNGGEQWLIGSTQNIQWTSSNVSGNVKIDLSSDGGSTFPTVLFANTANDGIEPWVVPGPAGTTYRIRISSVTDGSIRDSSDGNFIMALATITVTSPNGGEQWLIGSVQTIQWSSSNLSGNVKIDLSTDGGASFPTVLFASTANDGNEAWTVSGPASTTSRIRVSSVVDGSVRDSSHGNFTMSPATVTVTAPNGGEQWEVGTTHVIQWTTFGVTGNVKIELSRDGGGVYETLFGNTSNDGSEPWVVSAPLTLNGLIRISSVSVPSVQDVSNGAFSITPNFTLLTKLWLHDGGGVSDSLEWGTAAGATDGIDALYGEYEQPPLPPTGVLDVRWAITGTLGSKRDIRDTLSSSHQQIIYTGKLQAGEAGYPFVIRWRRSELPATGSFTLRDGPSGFFFSVNMRQQDSVVITDEAVVQFQLVYGLGTTVGSTVQGGWNVVSLPVTVGDRRKTAVFPTSVSGAYTFTPGGYVVKDTLNYGAGYWLKFPSTQTVSLTGGTRSTDTINVVQGWNMIGSISGSVAVGSIIQIPSGIVASSYYAYTGSYVPATAIDPAKGYWVKVNQNGKLVLIGSALVNPSRVLKNPNLGR